MTRADRAKSPSALVTEFCRCWAEPEVGNIVSYFTEDAVYHNIPMEPLIGREAIRGFVEGHLSHFDGVDFQIHRQVASDGLVMNERTDAMRAKGGGGVVYLPVTGVFEIVDGEIAAWRDYFDLGHVTRAFEALPS